MSLLGRRLVLEEDLEITRRQVIHLCRDILVSHFNFIFFILSLVHFQFLLILKLICMLGVDIEGHILDCWAFYLLFMVVLLLFFTVFILIA